MRKVRAFVGVSVSLLVAGSATAAVPGASWTAEYDVVDLQLGARVGSAGDVNGDGFDDLLLPTPTLNVVALGVGGAFVHLGSATGPSAAPSWRGHGAQVAEGLGTGAAGVGDVNGDGYDDVVLGSDAYNVGALRYAGRAVLYAGSPTGLAHRHSWMATGDTSYAYFGYAVAGAGDVNGDGYDDVIVGAWGTTVTQTGEGEALLYLGSASGLSATPDWRFAPGIANAAFGFSVATAGDVNGDGYDDVLIGAPYGTGTQNQEGLAVVFLGSAAGLGAQPAWTGRGGSPVTMYGWSVSAAGDVNGDGFADIVVGQPYWLNGGNPSLAGRALVYQGSAAGLGTNAAWIGSPGVAFQEFGSTVAGGGDLNGDGFDDIAVGIPGLSNPTGSEGAVAVYTGSATGLGGVPAVQVEGGATGANLGAGVGIAGDVNGDGFDDLVVGAPGMEHGQPYEGEAFLFDGR